MINKYTNKQRGLLAVIMAMFMVFAGAAFVAAEVDAGDAETESVVTEKDVTTEAEFNEIFTDPSNSAITTINIKNNIEVETGLTIDRSITVIGGNNTINGSVNKLITITSGDVTFSNISVTSTAAPNGTTWNAAITMDSTGKLTLNDVTVTSDCYGILINNGSLTATNLDATAWGAIYAVGQDVGDINITGTSELNGINGLNGKSNSFGALVLQSTNNTTTLTGTIINATDSIENDAYSWGISISAKAGESNTSTVILDGVSVNTGDTLALLNANAGDSTQSKMIIKNNVSVDGIIYYDGTIELDNDATLEVKCVEAEVQGTNYEGVTSKLKTADGTTADVDALYKTAGTITIKNGSLVIEGSVESGTITVVSGTYVVSSDVSADVTINLNDGTTLVISDDVEIGQNVIVMPATGNATIATPVGYDLSNVVENYATVSSRITVTSNVSEDNSLGLNKNLDTDLEIKSSAFLEKDLVIDEGVTLTVSGNAVFDLNGKKLTVLGNLVVKNNGVIQTVSGGAIEIGKTGSIDNKGVIGKGAGVRVNLVDNTSNYVTIKDAVGINFSQTKKVSNDVVTYTLCISGDVSKKGTATGEVKVDGNVSVKGDLSIGNGITLDVNGSLTITKGSTITIEGKGKIIGNGNVSIASGASITVDGSASVNFVAKTGKYITANGSTSLPTTTIVVNDIKGFTLNVTSESKYDEVAKADMTEQRLIVSGELKDADGKGESDPIKKNKFIVNGTTDEEYTGIFVMDVLAIDKGIELLGFYNAKVTVLGTVSYNGTDMPTNEEFTKAVIGAIYTVEATDADGVKTTTHYIKSFDEAIGIIDSVKDKTIDVYGPVKISSEITIAANQNVEGAAIYTITKDGKLIISNDATLNAKSVDVQGIMVVQVDGTAPSNITYNAKSENKETGDVTYYGFLVALQNAKAGDVIEISKSTLVSDSFTIPEGVTVEILTAGSIGSAPGKVVNMTVAGALVNEGTLTISGKTDVQGTVDLTEELSTTLNGDITVSGEIITATQYNGSNMNGAYYQNDDGEYVYTTPSKAVAAVSEMDIGRQVTFIGKVSDSTAIILDDVDMIVPDNATAAIGDVTVVKSKITILGTFSGTIIGKTGAEETTGAVTDTTVVLVKAQTMEIESKTTTNAQNVKVWSTTLKTTDSGTDLVGSVTVETGILTIPSNMNVNDSESTVTIGTDAGLLIPKGITVSVTEDSDAKDKTLMVIDGMIEVKGTLNINGPMVVNGTMDVSKNEDSPESTVNVSKMLTITGELKIGENETYGDGSVTIANGGVLVVGDKPATLGVSGSVTGPVDIDIASAGNGFIIVYASGDVSSAKIQWNDVDEKSGAKSTIFNINNQPYMTVYALGGKVPYDTVLGIADIELVGYNTSGIDKIKTGEKTYWFTDVDLTDKADETGHVGDDTNLYYKAPAVDVEFNVSVGFGISLYIDGLNIKNDTVMLSVGTHTVSATVDPGYTGSITISFNGIAVTDGKIVVTPEMASAAYDGAKVVSATGDITTVAPEVSVEDKDEGMDLTDILLIVLVVLIVIMAIIVALRIMRS